MGRHAAQRNLVGFCIFEGRDFKLLSKKQTVLLLVYISAHNHIHPSLSLFGEAVTKGTGLPPSPWGWAPRSISITERDN